MPAFKDLTGQIVNNWKIIEFSHFNKHHASCWVCECQCKYHTRKVKTISQMQQVKQCLSCSRDERVEDLYGLSFGGWDVIGHSYRKNGHAITLCQSKCEHTEVREIRNDLLKSDNPPMCSICRKNNGRAFGLSKTRIHHIWDGMNRRCYDPNNKSYKNYGERGITICDEWLGKNGFLNFYNWALDNGYSELLSIERMDVNKGYSPDNCTWIPMPDQSKNRTITLYYEIDGEKDTVANVAKANDMNYATIKDRIKRNIDQDKIFNYLHTNNTSGFTGVSWCTRTQSYRTYISYNKKRIELGYYKNINDAIMARLRAENKYYPGCQPQRHLFEQYGITPLNDCEERE